MFDIIAEMTSDRPSVVKLEIEINRYFKNKALFIVRVRFRVRISVKIMVRIWVRIRFRTRTRTIF